MRCNGEFAHVVAAERGGLVLTRWPLRVGSCDGSVGVWMCFAASISGSCGLAGIQCGKKEGRRISSETWRICGPGL